MGSPLANYRANYLIVFVHCHDGSANEPSFLLLHMHSRLPSVYMPYTISPFNFDYLLLKNHLPLDSMGAFTAFAKIPPLSDTASIRSRGYSLVK